MNAIRFAVGFAAGLADSFCSIETRDRIMRSVARTGRTLDGFDLAADICSAGRRFRQRFIPRKHLGNRVPPAEIDFDLFEDRR